MVIPGGVTYLSKKSGSIVDATPFVWAVSDDRELMKFYDSFCEIRSVNKGTLG